MPMLHPNDQNNSLLSGVPATLRKLQKVQNAAAKVILQDKKREHQTHELLQELNWLSHQSTSHL